MSATVIETPDPESLCLARSNTCVHHFHDSDPSYLEPSDDAQTTKRDASGVLDQTAQVQKAGRKQQPDHQTKVVGWRMIVQNFTPSYVSIAPFTPKCKRRIDDHL